jgi:hypothetical protein
VEAGNSLTVAPWTKAEDNSQIVLLEDVEQSQRYGSR